MIPNHINKEKKAIKALSRYDILDTISENEYNEITKIASEICRTTMAFVSVIDSSRKWFKSHRVSLLSETPQMQVFCKHTTNTPGELFIVCDATKDERFKDNLLTFNNEDIIFYAGISLTTNDGYTLGTLCVLDTKPRELTRGQQECLEALAHQVMGLLALRSVNKSLLVANDEISRLNTQLKEFAYRLSHDLKTPVRGVKSIAEILKEDYSKVLDDQGNYYVELISSRVDFLDSLINGMLNFNTATNDKIRYEDFNFKKLIQLITEKNNFDSLIEIDFVNCDLSIKQSKVGFLQIFQNLLSNSIKFSDKEKCLIAISFQNTSKFHEIIFKDNGTGIPDKYHKKIFKLFETLNEKKGNGIGLSTVQSIIHRLGGEIEIEKNIKDVGATFTLTFPILNG
jgi:hypothetical protein